MYIAAIIAVFVLTSWCVTYLRAHVFNEGARAIYEMMSVIPSVCITFLLVYYKVI